MRRQMCWLSDFFKKLFTVDVPSPSDIVPHAGIIHWATDNKVEVALKKLNIPFNKSVKVWIPSIPDTGSMDPIMDAEHNNILIAGADEGEHRILLHWLSQQPPGNIVVYRIPDKIYAIHRIVKVEHDDEGVKYTLRGDNNPVADPYTVRDANIEWLCIGTIY